MNDRVNLQMPTHWSVAQLADVCSKVTDGTHKTPIYQQSGVRFISIKNIRPFQPVNWDSYVKFITQEEHRELTKRCKPEFDDILFPRIGTLGFAKRIDFDEEVSIFVGLGLLKPKKDVVLPKYLEYWMNHPLITRLSREKATGSGRLTLALEETRKFPIPLAPLDEQATIVAEIEKQFSRLDEAVTNLNRVKANLKRYKAAVLSAAARGLFTSPDLPRKSRAIPEGWRWIKVQELASDQPRSIQSGPFGSNLRHSEFQTTGRLVIGIDNVQDGIFTIGSDHRISEKKYRQLDKYSARPGDVLITVMATIGRVCVVPRDIGPALITKHVYRITVNRDLIFPDFLATALRGAPEVRAQIFGSVQGQTRPGLNGALIKGIRVPVPPLAEQRRILAEVDRRLSLLRETESDVAANLARSESLRHSVLAQAFSGQLFNRNLTKVSGLRRPAPGEIFRDEVSQHDMAGSTGLAGS